jgi:phthalate 4,5-cis-dihydrodiol dehydrogenase
MTEKPPPLRIGAAGLGRAFSMMVPTLAGDARVRLVAGADPRAAARAKFESDFGARAFASVDELCADPEVQVVYVATPHQFHAEHAIAAAARGKHVLVEKPMALTMADCRAMARAAHQARVQLVVGHSHSFDAPIAKACAIIASGALGRLRMVSALNYTDFLYRPRRPEELDSALGGGVVFNQAAHQVDVVRRLAASPVKTVRAFSGAWDPTRPTEGAYSALLGFADGAFATLVYSGYAHFDSDELAGWIGESGARKDPASYGAARRLLNGDELALKNERNYGGTGFRGAPKPQAHPHFGFVVASCERGDLRPLPTGVVIYADDAVRTEPLPPPAVPRVEVIDELCAAVLDGRPPLHGGDWGTANLEACLAIVRSAREGREIAL